ncbi:MAG: hypothetical protein HY820_40125 [Acidobacteria bacterium]|nr:hypothetical protein [Acidobacteriota bacterium]
MTAPARKALFWAPRLLCIAFGLFASIFALDVFQGNQSFWRILAALFMHLIPVFVLFAILAVAWRWEWVGAVTYSAMAVLHLIWANTQTHLRLPDQALIAGPLFVVAALFLMNWLKRADLRPAREQPPFCH